MKKKTIALLLVTNSITSCAFASPIIDKLVPGKTFSKTSISKTIARTKHSAQGYTDFSGTWVGDCGFGELEVKIENDPNHITLDSHEYTIGAGLQGSYDTNQSVFLQNNLSFEWNEDESTLIMNEVAVSKTNIDGSEVGAFFGTSTYTMKNDQLMIDGALRMFTDIAKDAQPFNFHCVMNRKQ